ncbi:MAG: chromosomal replication initiator protein DnaA [Erysipelotrichaceae bacterium]|nr:chromosomal replication initiator protein DnaA [Erysipelotrichaceae bacterium]MBQ5552946.1 chromosomal replication initiator protein DnaA [Erysipelotrichaceae bacterium]MEE3424747.1 chromosomal replication initiator protein DnaA [Erysipelotrichaceae bacterium]
MTTLDFYLHDKWSQTCKYIADSGQIAESVLPYFDSKLVSLNDSEAVVTVPAFINYAIMSEHVDLIENCLEESLGKRLSVRIVQQEDFEKKSSVPKNNFKSDFLSRKIDPNQTFADFVVGRSNAQAQVAAMTCASNLGVIFNPLFIYGNPGLGKTHLLNAIGNQVKSLYPEKKIGFVSGLEFVDNVKKASQENRFDELKEVFQDLDLLLIDDIQNIAGKDKTNELFFTIYNELINNKKQICVTSDRTPSEIRGLSDRIISRFNQGLNVNIEAPEYETSINILKMKIANYPGYNKSSIDDIDDDVFSYLATNFSQDVRSLEGAVNRLLFYSAMFPNLEEGNRITLKLAVEAFKDQIKDGKNELAISTVRKAVCDYYNLTKQQITSANRTKSISNARQIAMYLCRKLLDATYDDIGQEFGGRDHSTVMSSISSVEKKIKTDPLYLKAINEIESRIK